MGPMGLMGLCGKGGGWARQLQIAKALLEG
jgi:hypothetical protein